jgi:hypothetical protein
MHHSDQKEGKIEVAYITFKRKITKGQKGKNDAADAVAYFSSDSINHLRDPGPTED